LQPNEPGTRTAESTDRVVALLRERGIGYAKAEAIASNPQVTLSVVEAVIVEAEARGWRGGAIANELSDPVAVARYQTAAGEATGADRRNEALRQKRLAAEAEKTAHAGAGQHEVTTTLERFAAMPADEQATVLTNAQQRYPGRNKPDIPSDPLASRVWRAAIFRAMKARTGTPEPRATAPKE